MLDNKISINQIDVKLEEFQDFKTNTKKLKCTKIKIFDEYGNGYIAQNDNMQIRKIIKENIYLPKSLPTTFDYKVSINLKSGTNTYSISETDSSPYFKSNLSYEELCDFINQYKTLKNIEINL